MDRARARRPPDQTYRVLDEPRGEERLSLAGPPERHERSTRRDVLRRETGDLLGRRVERGGLARLGLTVEARRDRRQGMLVRGGCDR